LKEQKVLWANLNAKVVDFVTMSKKKKSRIGQLEVQMIMFKEMLKKMQEGGGFMLYSQTMLHDFHFRLDFNVVQCPNKLTIVVNNYRVCALDGFLRMILLLLIVAIHIMCFILNTMWVFTYFTQLLIIREHFTLLGYNVLVFNL